MNKKLKQIIADVANETRRLMSWRASSIKEQDETESWFDSIISRLNELGSSNSECECKCEECGELRHCGNTKCGFSI